MSTGLASLKAQIDMKRKAMSGKQGAKKNSDDEESESDEDSEDESD